MTDGQPKCLALTHTLHAARPIKTVSNSLSTEINLKRESYLTDFKVTQHNRYITN